MAANELSVRMFAGGEAALFTCWHRGIVSGAEPVVWMYSALRLF